MEFLVENWLDIKAEMIPLVADHWPECNSDPREPFDLDELKYDTLAGEGMMHITTARLEGKLIGYVASMLMTNINSKSVFGSFEMGWYVTPEHRKGGLGIKIKKIAEENLKAAGVQVMYSAIPAKMDLSVVMEKLGWSVAEVHYKKWIGA